ncbi:hypothetical protein IMCC3317_19780 [Kordia antarctica]|uniref:EF-hand domain-containing protein n=1 Tax=Kordia antarctica TaxID=1218801 RepID=A0A7L4ZJ35_9FLAO|nr:EF-hand domain-containing protein [Kordia antarctica]QHI36615.1 hypothetical protein IMCC3317_19780 [Kordia antarctica]
MKHGKFKTGVVLGMLTFLFTVSVNAQSQNRQERKAPPTFEQLLKEMDANEDGKLSKDELKGPLKENFAKIDTDEDGFISKKEFKNAPKPARRKKQ